jgi:alanine dehydrogenase
MLHLTEQDVLELLPMGECIRLVREAFQGLASGTAQNHPRRRLFLPGGAVLHSLAGAWGGYFGTKIYSTHPKHGAHFLVVLYDAATARPLALLEANHLGQIRTGAATGVATDLMAPKDADTLAVIGSGFQAKTQVEAVMAVREIKDVRVWSRSQERRETFAASLGGPARAAGSAREAIEGASIIVTATFAKDPVLESAWVGDGAHVNAVGSNNPQRRELPAELLDRASLIAVDSLEQARIESGDLLLAWPPETWPSKPIVELAALAGGCERPDGITIFKSNGLGVQDVAAAAWVYEQAVARRS